MEQYELGLISPEGVKGKCLDPQPKGYMDCSENHQTPGVFNFYTGNEMEGHDLVMTVHAPSLDLEPRFDLDKKLWMWDDVSNATLFYREWWKKYQ